MKRKQCKRLIFFLLFTGLFLFTIEAQIYDDHFGTGNDVGVNVTSSPTQGLDSSGLTLNGTGYFPDLAGASRFLAQAGFGGTYEEIEYVTQIGIEAWIEEQFNITPDLWLPKYQSLYAEITNMIHAVHPGEDIEKSRSYTDFMFWDRVFRDPDVLRNKAAFALSQILVLSTRSIKLKGKGYGATNFYDILYGGAFGNFRDILEQVTLHPMMGFYLSHLQNIKADPALGTLPDENYAREIMQLFTIGLYELNNDGSRKLDSNGDPIPTYDIDDIQELAKVFTGLSGGAWDLVLFPGLAGTPLNFGSAFNRYDATVPMIMWENQHEQSSKTMIDGSVIPAGQPGMQDIQDALDVLFNHPNVGPFLARRLIQQLVKSNPTPAYINRVAMVFNNNGQGVRGDMKAVFKIILLDPEARACNWDVDFKMGKLRQPIERISSILRGFNVDSPSGKLWMSDYQVLFDRQEQVFMGSPTVFNFFSPFYAEDECVEPNNMVSPEFQILHSVSAIHYLNLMENAISDQPFRNFTAVNENVPNLRNNNDDQPFIDLSDEIAILDANGINALLDRLDLILCHGQLSQGSKTIIADALTQMQNTGNFTSEQIVNIGLYFIVATAEFTILK